MANAPGVYAKRLIDAAVKLSTLGVAVIPVDPEGKKPLIESFGEWRKPPTVNPIRAWWHRWPDSGLGILTGSLNGLTVVDIDDPALIAEAIDTYGDSPVQVDTPSGGRHLYFRYADERNRVRVDGQKIDIRGQGGLAVAPPTIRTDRKFYSFVKGDWDCIRDLPKISASQRTYLGKAEDRILEGQRDDALFSHCLRQAPACDDYETLRDVAHTFNENCLPPLPERQVEKTAESAWKYEFSGENWVGTRGVTHINCEIRDDLQRYPYAFVLLDQLKSSHEGRHPQFAICADAMVRDGSLPGWTSKRINNSRRRLVNSGYLDVVHQGGKGRGDPSQYAFTGKGVRKGHEYN